VTVIKRILYLLFGEWNGVQNFAAPAVFAFLFDKVSFLQWLSALLTYQRQYLPLFLYLCFLMYMLLMIVKAMVQWENCNPAKTFRHQVKLGRDFLFPLIIRMHKWLLIFITIAIFIYVLKNVYVFMYKASLPLMTIYMSMARIGFIAGMLYVYLLCDVTIPYIKKGHNFERAMDFFHKYLIKKWKFTLLYYANQFMIVMLSILLFKVILDALTVSNWLGIFGRGVTPLQLNFAEVHSVRDLIGNVMIFPIAFLFSNALYSPLMILVRWIFDIYRKRFSKV
jgi:hypothetical protein